MRTLPLLLAVGGLCGCVAPSEPAPAPVEAAAPLAWDYDDGGADALVSAAALTARLQQAVVLARTFDAGPILAGYDAAMRSQAPGCPHYLGLGEFQYWYDDCVTPTGDRFDGYTFFAETPDSADYTHDGLALWGASDITLADGRVFHLGGRVEGSVAEGQGQKVWLSRVSGTFRWDGAEADGTWLGEGYALDLEMIGNRFADGSDGRGLQLQGGIDGFSAPLGTVRFEGVVVTAGAGAGAGDTGDTGADLSCAAEPTGGISARDDAGHWYELRVDGGDTEASDAARCDGCGTVWFEGAALYEVCLDFTPLTDWDDSGPW